MKDDSTTPKAPSDSACGSPNCSSTSSPPRTPSGGRAQDKMHPLQPAVTLLHVLQVCESCFRSKVHLLGPRSTLTGHLSCLVLPCLFFPVPSSAYFSPGPRAYRSWTRSLKTIVRSLATRLHALAAYARSPTFSGPHLPFPVW